MLRGSFCWFIVTTPAEVAFRLVLGPPKRAELVPLQASARNCRFQVSCSLKALNMERSALGGMGGQRLGNTPLSVPSGRILLVEGNWQGLAVERAVRQGAGGQLCARIEILRVVSIRQRGVDPRRHVASRRTQRETVLADEYAIERPALQEHAQNPVGMTEDGQRPVAADHDAVGRILAGQGAIRGLGDRLLGIEPPGGVDLLGMGVAHEHVYWRRPLLRNTKLHLRFQRTTVAAINPMTTSLASARTVSDFSSLPGCNPRSSTVAAPPGMGPPRPLNAAISSTRIFPVFRSTRVGTGSGRRNW